MRVNTVPPEPLRKVNSARYECWSSARTGRLQNDKISHFLSIINDEPNGNENYTGLAHSSVFGQLFEIS